MEWIIEKKLKSAKHGSYNGAAYLLHSVLNTANQPNRSIFIINNRLSAKLLLAIAETNYVKIETIMPFDCDVYHAKNGTLFDQRSTLIVTHPMQFEQEIVFAGQFCRHYGAGAVLVKPSTENNLYEVYQNC